MRADQPPVLHRETVSAQWIDYNGHMNLAYYLLVFDHATDAMLEEVHLGETYRASSGHTVYVLEAHVNYLAETLEGDGLAVATQLLDCDAKRLHYFHRMYRERDRRLAATTEQVLVHVDRGAGRSAPMPERALAAAEALVAAHAAFGMPEYHGRTVGLGRGSA